MFCSIQNHSMIYKFTALQNHHRVNKNSNFIKIKQYDQGKRMDAGNGCITSDPNKSETRNKANKY